MVDEGKTGTFIMMSNETSHAADPVHGSLSLRHGRAGLIVFVNVDTRIIIVEDHGRDVGKFGLQFAEEYYGWGKVAKSKRVIRCFWSNISTVLY